MVALSAVVPLGPEHSVEAFTCGDQDIDRFLREQAAVEQGLKLSQVYVSAGPGLEVMAYFTLSPVTARVERALLSRLGVGSIPYPVLGGFLLGRLGVASSLQGRGIGEALVMRAAQIAKRESEVVGGAFLAVDPKSERLARWYAQQEFVTLGAKTRRMVLPLKTVP